MDVVGAVRDLLSRIFGDENEAAAYAIDPEGYLAAEGISDHDLSTCDLPAVVQEAVQVSVPDPEMCTQVIETLQTPTPLTVSYTPGPEEPELAAAAVPTGPEETSEAPESEATFPAPDPLAEPDVTVLQQYINYVTVQVYQDNSVIVNQLVACCCPPGEDQALIDPAELDDPPLPVEEYGEPPVEEMAPPVDEGYGPEPEDEAPVLEEPPVEEMAPPVDEGYGPKPDPEDPVNESDAPPPPIQKIAYDDRPVPDQKPEDDGSDRRDQLPPEEQAALDKLEAELARIEAERKAAEAAAAEEKRARQYLDDDVEDMGFGTGSSIKADPTTYRPGREAPPEAEEPDEPSPTAAAFGRHAVLDADTSMLDELPKWGLDRGGMLANTSDDDVNDETDDADVLDD